MCRTEGSGSRMGRVTSAPRKNYRIDSRSPCGSVDGSLLISETALPAAVRTGPGNGITRHAPQVLLHALSAYLKTASTYPAEKHLPTTHVANVFLSWSPSGCAFSFCRFSLPSHGSYYRTGSPIHAEVPVHRDSRKDHHQDAEYLLSLRLL